MDALTTLERLRPDDELLDDDALERIWNTAILRATPERRPDTERHTSELSLGVAVADDQRPRHRRVTVERTSALEPQPRRWPALAAAAVVLLAAGSLMWAAVRREATDGADIGASDQDRLAALMADAVEYPVSAADPPEGPSTALSFREPGTVRAVTTPSGMTVFRESGVTAAPGYGVFEARCVGLDGRTSGCELPNASGLPWIPDPARTGVSVWVDVPAEVDVVVLIDGDNRLWQRPVSQLAVWPSPTDPDWSVEAFDTTGRSIARIDQSTIDERNASSSPNSEPDDAASSGVALSNFRACLVTAGATFDRDATLPQFAEGVDASATWDRCVASALPGGPREATPLDVEARSTNMVIDPAPPGDPFRTDVTSSTSTLRIYTQDRPDPENGPWIMVGWSPEGTAGVPTVGDPLEPDRQFFDGGRGYVISVGVDPAEIRRLINGAVVEADGRRSIDPTELPDGLRLAFDGDQVSDAGRRARGSSASEVAWWVEPGNGPFVRLLVADDPDMTGWRTGRVRDAWFEVEVEDTRVDEHPAYLLDGAGVRVLSWHDGSRWLQLVASDATEDQLLDLARDVRQADPAEWADIRLADDTGSPSDANRATIGPPGSDTTPILSPTTIGSVTLPDGTELSITAADFGELTLSDADGFVISSISAGGAGAVVTPMRVTADVSPEAATGDLVYGIVVAGSSITIRDDATGEEIPVALTDERVPMNGFVGFAARLPISTTYATMTVTDPTTGTTTESPIGY
ncbi:MAG: hypothetical protein F2534_20645 [Actinobacteria bacterium]|uniref:Unannotated protein n=1 Tax=freshwater metagenome TaxID=449393 RepID=A0A6J6G9E4_9ZZZZ|nr:hypothetical protein [Actinomycetota bacterium]